MSNRMEDLDQALKTIADIHNLEKVSDDVNRWEPKNMISNSSDFYYRLTSLGFQPNKPVGFIRRNEAIKKRYKVIKYCLFFGFLAGLITGLVL